ncbi:hypothetical protein Tam1G_2135 [Bifidobacterium imperatoris]|uniref:Uncharacterized protein n=1 Tax=Bifidobacterium imperatoris TaxID=2020965 RepID=A0A2N5IPC2_9BIFI|nr:hypothetical protein Tam1G_2135 [Bifidobacterium imperatoris]
MVCFLFRLYYETKQKTDHIIVVADDTEKNDMRPTMMHAQNLSIAF